jgi:hypothetical protein
VPSFVRAQLLDLALREVVCELVDMKGQVARGARDIATEMGLSSRTLTWGLQLNHSTYIFSQVPNYKSVAKSMAKNLASLSVIIYLAST